MKKAHAALTSLLIIGGLSLTGCAPSGSAMPENTATPDTEVEVQVPENADAPESTFVDGVLTLTDVKIEITDYRVIPVGEVGNEYGSAPVLAIWYNTTNLGTADREITPSEFIYNFEAFQDNDPNRENTLDIGALPDQAFLESQISAIKPGGTVANAVAYHLDDTTTPVELVAGRFAGEIGRMTITLS